MAQEAKYPAQPQGYVSDYAGLLAVSDREEITRLARELEDKTTAQVAVVTVLTTHPETIEGYAVRLFQNWGIGQKGKDNGVLFLIAFQDKAVRIETGYGLEGALPDVICNQIIQNIVIPHFKNGNYAQGILRGASVIIGLAAKEYNVEINGVQSLGELPRESNSVDGFALFFILIFVVFFLMIWPGLFLPPNRRGGRGNYWYGGYGGYPGGAGAGGFGGSFGGFGGGLSGGGGASGRW